MADPAQTAPVGAKKSGGLGKTLSDIFTTLGTVANPIGKVLLGPGAANIDFGAPFGMIGGLLQQRNREKGLINALGADPELGPIAGQLSKFANQPGGVVGALQNSNIDFTSPDFLGKLIQGDNADLARQIIVNQSQKKVPTAMDLEMARYKLLGEQTKIAREQAELANMRTPEQEARLQFQTQTDIHSANRATDVANPMPNQVKSLPAARLQLRTDVNKSYNESRNLEKSYDKMVETNPEIFKDPDLASQGIRLLMEATVAGDDDPGKATKAAAQAFFRDNPGLAPLQNFMTKYYGFLLAKAKSDSGLAYTDNNLRMIMASLPQMSFTPESFKVIMQDFRAGTRAYQLSMALEDSAFAGEDDRRSSAGIKAEDIRKFKALKEFQTAEFDAENTGQPINPQIRDARIKLEKELGVFMPGIESGIYTQ